MNKYESLKNRIKGPVYSILTPFKQDESVDYETLSKYIDFIYKGGGRIFYAMAYNSRYSQLSDSEILELNRFVIREVKSKDPGNICIVGDPIHCSTKVSIGFACDAEKEGADLISLIFREKLFYDDQVLAHFNQIASATDIGILVHEMPFLSGLNGQLVNWPISLLSRVADIPNVIAIKEDAKDDAYTREVIDTIKNRLAIILSGGGKRQWMRFADDGVSAWLNGIAVFEPVLGQLFYKAYTSGDHAFVRRIIEEIEVPFFEQCVQKHGWHLAIKAALEARGVMSRKDRMPLMELPEDRYHEVYRVISSLPIDEIAGT